jgi:WD40 repeat protein
MYEATEAESLLLPGRAASPLGMDACDGALARVVSSGSNKVYKCPQCSKSYAQELTLAMHTRIAHSRVNSALALHFADAASSGGDSAFDSLAWKPPGQASPSLLKSHALLQRSQTWRPNVTLEHQNTTLNAVWGSQAGQYLACGGAAGVVVYNLLDLTRRRYSFATDSVVKAITGSGKGRVLAYGLKSGDVVMRDMSAAGRLIETVPARKGKIFALWLAEDGCSLVVCFDGCVETWVRPEFSVSADAATGRSRPSAPGLPSGCWHKLRSWENKAMNSRFLGQHSLCGVTCPFSWRGGPEKGDTLLALGGPEVNLWTLQGTVVATIPSDKICNAVWLSPDCKLLVAACGTLIMVWSLPDLELVHVLQAHSRVWALDGNASILASAGSDSTVTIRSLETGAALLTFPQSGHVFSLWGLCGSQVLSSAGRGDLMLHKIGQAMVVHDVPGTQEAWIESVSPS